MKTIKFLLLMLVSVVMTSCWTVQSVTVTDIPEKYIGNAFDDLVGMTKAEVLEDMSVPDRTMGDGLGGEILVYEKKEQVTKTTGRVTTSSTTNVSTKPVTNAWTGETSLSSTGRTSTTNTQNSTAHQASLSMGFSRQESWSGLPLPSPTKPSRTNTKKKIIGDYNAKVGNQEIPRIKGKFGL